MDFKLNIGKLTETIAAYDKILEKLSEEKEKINDALNRLYEEGWSGQAREKFEEVHKKKQLLYTEVEENIKYLKDILENEEKPRAVELKKRSEDFVNKVARGGGGSGAVTSDDEGIISLLYSGVDKLDSIIDNCTDNHYNRMERQYDYVDELLGQLCYTSFGIGGDIDECYAAVQEQTHNLIDFRDSLGAYNQGVIEMEDNLVSKLSFIQESTNISFKTDYDSGVSEDAEIMLIYISSLLTKRIDELSEDEKEFLDKVEIVLGAENYKELKDLIWAFIVAKVQDVHVMDEKKLDEKFDRVKSLLENERILRISIPNIPLISKEDEDNDVFDFIKSSASKSWDSFKEIASDLWKGVEIRGSKWNDSPYDFINWLTLGLPDTVKSLGEMNYQNGTRAFNTSSFYDIVNWITMNQFDMIKGTFNPDEPFSKEHWLDSLGTASVLFGLRDIHGRKPNLNVKEESYTFKSMERLDIEGVSKADNLWTKSTCNNDELYNYLLKNVNEDVANKFLKEGKWPDGIQIPKNSSVVNPDGSINWSKAAEGGYTLSADGTAIKQQFNPQIGEVIDRYGNANGRYTSPVIDGKPFSYTERSLPYVEDLSNYHKYEVVGDFSKLKDYIKNSSDIKLKTQIDAAVTKYYDGDYSKLVSYKGEIAGIKGWGTGGGIQYEFSVTVNQLEKLGLLKEIK